MQDWAEHLRKLQDADLRIGRLQQQIDNVPAEKEEVCKRFEEEKEALQNAHDKVIEDEKAIKHAEMEIESLNDKQRDFETKSAMIKDNDEYRAALHQIEWCKKQITDIEDRELALMEDLEQARREHAREKKAVEAAEKRMTQMLADLDKREENCREQLEQLQEERSKYAVHVPKDILSKYDRIRQSRMRSGGELHVFAEVRDSSCSSCHMNVPPQVKTNARKGQVESCPHCGALLYADT